MRIRAHLLLSGCLALFCAGVVAGEGSFVFSKEPIDPAKPQNLSTRFAAGDHIYGLIQMPRTWREMGKVKGDKLILAVYTVVGSKRLGAYMELRSPKYFDSKHLVFDVAPALNKMTAYRDDGIFYGDAPGGIKKGACQITEWLAKQSAGKHVVKFNVLLEGKRYAQSEFTIEGQDFSMYRKIHEEIKKELTQERPFPAAKMKNKEMEAKMVKLLKNAGWKNVVKLHIVDKDWWIDRIAGGNSPIKSRHMAAAAAYKAGNSYYYKICTFHEMMLITGKYGPLKLTHQGKITPISAEKLGAEATTDAGPDMGAVAKSDQPDFSNVDAVLADIEKMRLAAMKKKVFALVGKCSGAKYKVKREVKNNPKGYEGAVKRIWLGLYEEYKKIK